MRDEGCFKVQLESFLKNVSIATTTQNHKSFVVDF